MISCREIYTSLEGLFVNYNNPMRSKTKIWSQNANHAVRGVISLAPGVALGRIAGHLGAFISYITVITVRWQYPNSISI